MLYPDEDNLVAVILRIGAERQQVGYGIRGNPVQRPVIPVISNDPCNQQVLLFIHMQW